MNHIALSLLTLLLACTSISAQNTLRPRPLHLQFPAHALPLADTNIMRHPKKAWVSGHQWGGPEFRKINQALSTNFMNGDWSYFVMNTATGIAADLRNKAAVRRLNPNVINYLGWGLGRWAEASVSTELQRNYFRSWVGMRWEPAENATQGVSWTPRDSLSWPYGFEVRHDSGIVSNVSTDTNYRRFVLDTSRFAGTMPVKVLDSCNPRVSLWRADTVGPNNNIRNGEKPLWDSSSGERMYLVINLRRLDSADTTSDDAPVLRLTVEGRRFEPDFGSADPNDYMPLYFNFRRLPDPTGASIVELREARGKVLGMVNAPATTDTMIITRRMLPEGNGRDITITAEFRTDVIFRRNGNGNWVIPADSPRIKRTEFLGQGPPHSQAENIDTITPVVWFYDSTSVAIQSVSIVTPYTFDVLCGNYDELYSLALLDEFDIIDDVRDYYRDSVGSTNPLYIAHFYGPDEFGTRDELGMVYRAHLLNRFSNSETGYEGSHFRGNYTVDNGRKRMHIMPFHMFWTSGLGYTGTLTPSPMFPYSDQTLAPYTTLGLGSGYMYGQSVPVYSRPYSTAYETIGWSDIHSPGNWDSFAAPLDSRWATDSVYERIMSPNLNIGVMGSWEKSLYQAFYKNDWYFTKPSTPWITHGFYHYRMDLGRDSATASSRYVRLGVWRPETGEEVRLELSTAIAFGAKGFAYDKIFDLLASAWTGPDFGTAAFSRHREPGIIMNRTGTDWDGSSLWDSTNILRNAQLGDDYLPDNDAWRIGQFKARNLIAGGMKLSRCFSTDSARRIYLGMRSMRCEIKKWHDLVMHPDFTDVMYKMLPVAWYGQGYRKLTKGNMVDLKYWIDTTKAATKLYHWTRDSASGWTNYALREEPIGERFYDYVLLDTASGTAAVQDNCILAVINRRTAPGLIDFTRTDSVNPITTFDFDDLVASAPEWRYRQLGARRIVIPFHYDNGAAQPSLLHVKELSLDSAVRIDTILSDISKFAVDFKPGQTRFFQIKRLRAIDTTNSGYLAYSTQNKMIAYPVAKSDSSGYTDSIRYHMVFHRKDEDSLRTGPWTVYYQRSVPYHRDSLPLVAGLEWESPIRLSGLTTSSIQTTDGLNRTLFYEIDEAVDYLPHVPQNTDAAKDCCCGFPSIVVREFETYAPKVFVVYACEDEWIPTGLKNNYFHIVENMFDDAPVLNAAALNANGKSLIICQKNLNHDGGGTGDSLKSLSKFGTPVINAAALSRNYYAWSSSNAGIGAGVKSANVAWFPAANAVVAIPSPDIVSVTGDTIRGGSALYPSVNVYSNLAQGGHDASLVWQEGVVNPHIRYTRLTTGGGANIMRYLPVFVEMSYHPSSPPSIPVDVANNIAVVGGASIDDDAGFPVVVRSLQADTMSLFLRDSAAGINGLMKYNHETVAWEEYVRPSLRSRIRYNHFIDNTAFWIYPGQLHYWYANTTYDNDTSLFHPVLTNGKLRLDSLTWQGVVGDTLITYDDSLHFVQGDLSDSALIVNYSMLADGAYTDLKSQKSAGYSSYWTGHRQFNALGTQQIFIRRTVGAPAPFGIFVHIDTLRANGAWPHLAMRRTEALPTGIPAVRRVLQYTNDVAPKLIASAEQFYKLSSETKTSPVLFGGFEVRGQKVTARAVLSDGRSLSFRPVYYNTMPEGFVGSTDYAWQMAAMTTPATELVSQTFAVGDVDELKLLTSGLLREDVNVSLEEVRPSPLPKLKNGRAKGEDYKEPAESFSMAMALSDEKEPEAVGKARYYLTSGENKSYRLRMKYTGGDVVVFREDLEIEPEIESFEKTGNDPVRIIDLRSMEGTTIGRSADLRIYPNPSSDRVTIIVDGLGLTPNEVGKGSLVLDVVDGLGRMMLTSAVSLGEAVDVSGLPEGVYVARVRGGGTVGVSVKASGQFSIIK